MATSKVLKPRRGSTAEHATFKGQAFEITFDTDKKTVVAHDGLTMGGFPLAHETVVAETDNALRALIEQKVAEVEGVSSNELRALESTLRGLINNNTQQQVVRDNNQDNVIAALDATLRALIAEEVAKAMTAASDAQSTADAAYPKAGGTLDGAIIRTALLAKNSVDDNLIAIRGGTDGTSAVLVLCGKNHENKGAAYLQASDGTNISTLFVAPDGGLSCKSKNVWDGFAPSAEVQQLSLVASNTVITAPASGYICAVARSSVNDMASLLLQNRTSSLSTNVYCMYATNVPLRQVIPVRKGDKVMVYYNNATLTELYFTPSIGGTI